jgi:hypothetical protein
MAGMAVAQAGNVKLACKPSGTAPPPGWGRKLWTVKARARSVRGRRRVPVSRDADAGEPGRLGGQAQGRRPPPIRCGRAREHGPDAAEDRAEPEDQQRQEPLGRLAQIVEAAAPERELRNQADQCVEVEKRARHRERTPEHKGVDHRSLAKWAPRRAPAELQPAAPKGAIGGKGLGRKTDHDHVGKPGHRRSLVPSEAQPVAALRTATPPGRGPARLAVGTPAGGYPVPGGYRGLRTNSRVACPRMPSSRTVA